MNRIDTLSMPLPEDILKRKWAGDISGAMAAIDLRMEEEMPEALRTRLEVEKERLRRLPTQYPWNHAQALEKLQELIPDMTDEEFCRYELRGKVDFIYLNGEKRYMVRFHKTMAKFPELIERAGGKFTPVSKELDPMIAEIREKGCLSRKITLRTSVSVDENKFVPGEYLAHLPFPAKCAQQSEIRLISGDCSGIAGEDAPARTAWWRVQLEENRKFEITYSYRNTIRYADPLNQPAPSTVLYPEAKAPCSEDLQEEGAYIRFTPYLRELEQELSRGKTSPVEKAWSYYSFVTRNVKYSFMRDYFQIDNLGEYCAVNLKGDCGLQALLFIILCRIGGIPARWQSGMSISPDYVGSHDWTQFYLDGWGWLFADPSYGGSAWRNGNAERNRFYFGNLDPMRMVANRKYQAEFDPPMTVLRHDPFDNQSGEIERIGAELPFTGRDLDEEAELVNLE